MQNTRVSQLGHLLQVRVQSRRVEQDGGLPGGLPEGLGQVLHHFSGILVEQGIMLHDQEAVVVLLQDGYELEEGVGRRTSSSVKLRFSRLRMRELVAADEEDLVALQFQVAIEGVGQQLHRGDQDAEGLGSQGDGGEEFEDACWAEWRKQAHEWCKQDAEKRAKLKPLYPPLDPDKIPPEGYWRVPGDTPGMAADPGGEGHRCCREEGQEDRAVQSVERDCLAPLAEGRDMRGRGLPARGRQDAALKDLWDRQIGADPCSAPPRLSKEIATYHEHDM